MVSSKRVISLVTVAAGCGLWLAAPATSAQEAGNALKFEGAVRIRAEYLSWNPDRQGTLEFDTARIGFAYDDGRFLAAGRERYYHYSTRQSGGDGPTSLVMNDYLWAGMRFADQSQLRVGQQLMPFGLLPAASNNFFESMAYYVGYEDTYAMGAQYQRSDGGLNTAVAFFPSDGGHFLGGATDMAPLDGVDSIRYSNHLMPAYGRKETNTFVGRLAYAFSLGGGKSELGVSALAGQLDATTSALAPGDRQAQAIHYAGEFGPLGIQLETIRYRNSFSGAGSVAGPWWSACDNDCVIIGSYGFTNRLAAKGNIDIASLSYRIPGTLGPFGKFRIYNDWSRLRKVAAGYAASAQNVTGVEFGSGGWWIMLDFARGKNQPYLSPVFGNALAAGGVPSTGNRFNASIGYYF
jgi:hypothetical protein